MSVERPPEQNRASRLRRGALAPALFLVALAATGAAEAATVREALAEGAYAALVDLEDLYLEAPPLRGEGLLAFCRRLTGEISSCREIARVNRNPRRLISGVRYRVPYEQLTAERKLAVVRALFRDDRAEAKGWLHRGRGESLGRVAVWFAGSRDDLETLRRVNGRSGDAVKPGEELSIPAELLIPAFLPAVAAAQPAPEAARIAVAPAAGLESADLEYGEDAAGRYALYRLRGGEALYSAVVVRFTGRDHAEDVNALAAEIAKRSGIADVTDISVGYPVRIPYDVLLPQFLPEGDPRRLEWEVESKLAEQYRNPVRATGLRGVTVILDSGHGGADVGASRAGVWESVYVYDVMQRVGQALRSRTLASVETTTRDGDVESIPVRDVLPYSRKHRVLTTPPYPIADATTAVHLRWYLANSLLRRHSSQGSEDRVVFVSIHADSLHPSLRGATVYVPHAAGTAGSFGKNGGVFESRREVRERPRVSYSLHERQKSEGRSRDLAERIVSSFRRHELAVHPFRPVRDRIFRGRRAWVPAVLRYNAVPAKVLLEVCNLANDNDRRLLQSRAFREAVAAAVVDGILGYFGEAS